MIPRVILYMAIIACFFCKSEVRADIYRFDSEDATISFSDTPSDKRYRLVMKEQQVSRGRSGKGRYPGAEKKAGNSPPSRSLEQNSGVARKLPIEGVITSQAGLRSDPFNGRLKHHNGLDIAAPSGTPVKPVAPGTVIFSGWKVGFGNTVILEHFDGMTTVYAHHASNIVTTGTEVDMDTVIALSGSTGRSTGPHLHFEAWRDGRNITAGFMPGNTNDESPPSLAQAPIRRLLQADGTILFTNLQ